MGNSGSILDKLLDGHRLVTIRNWVSQFFVKKEEGKKLMSDEEAERIRNAIMEDELAEQIGGNIAPDTDVDAMITEVFGEAETGSEEESGQDGNDPADDDF